jgi:release factor glutamine methyltransferase
VDAENFCLGDVVAMLRARLAGLSDTAGLDAQVLVAHIAGKSRAWILAHPDEYLAKDAVNRLNQALSRLEKGEPLPYVLGQWEFYGLDFIVTPGVLIPRPETELMVENAGRWLEQNPGVHRAADIGAGSGCISVALAVNHPNLHILSADISWDALQVAGRNIEKHQVQDRVHLVQCDLLAPFGVNLDLICANLPYIADEVLARLDVFHREPSIALSGGGDGLALVRRFIKSSSGLLNPGGLLLAEIESTQGEAVKRLAEGCFPQSQVQILHDYSGHDRLLRIESRRKGIDR